MSLVTIRDIILGPKVKYGEFAKRIHFPHRKGRVSEFAGRIQEIFTRSVLECPLVQNKTTILIKFDNINKNNDNCSFNYLSLIQYNLYKL